MIGADDHEWHDPYRGLFGVDEPRFTPLERRFLLLAWLAGELGESDLTRALDDVAAEIDGEQPGALVRFDQLEERTLSRMENRLDVAPLDDFPAEPPALAQIRNRLRTLLCVAFFQDDAEGARQTQALARQILDGLPHSYDSTLDVADADLTIREELLLEVVAEDE